MTPRVLVLTRPGCHLCDQAIELVAEVCAETGEAYATRNVDEDPELRRQYTDQVPVTFVDGAQHDFWRVDPVRLRAALARPRPDDREGGRPPSDPPNQTLDVLFDLRTLRGLTEGRISTTYRRWTTVRPRPGSRFVTTIGVVEVTSIAPAEPAALTEEDAYAAGFESRDALLAWTAKKGTGDLYRIGIRLAGPDPRVALRAAGTLDEAEVAALTAKLDRMDRAADRPWTRQALELVAQHPGVVSTELAAIAGQERAYFKTRVRRLKALGLTESLEVGYRLSPRGATYLTRLRSDRPEVGER